MVLQLSRYDDFILNEPLITPMKQTFILLALLTLVFFLWNSPVLYPLNLLIVFFHESSHAIMTVITGGQVQEMVINPQQGGHVISLGGNRFLTLTAGYLGSLLWGLIIYTLAVRTDFDKHIMFILASVIIVITAFFIRDLFAFSFALGTALAMLLIAIKASHAVNDFLLRFIGLTNMMYVPLDIYSDTIARSHLRSDAFMLAEEIGGTTLLWGGIWIVLSAILVLYTLRLSLKIQPKLNPDAHLTDDQL